MLVNSFKTPFLALSGSFWPLLTRLSVFVLTSSVVLWFQYKLATFWVVFSVALTASLIFVW